MKEQLISFKTAKLAKEKGFNITNRNSYDENTGLMLPLDPYGHCYALEGTCPAPTQSLLQKWLREEHKIYIEICHSYRDLTHYTYHVYTNWEEYSSKMMKAFNNELKHFLTYEEALEAGLQKALSCI